MPTTRRKSKLLKYLPKAASAVSFQNPVFSPGREKQRLYSSSGFSGPIVSIIPDEARRRPRKGHEEDGGLGSTQEPSSPKVSCIGQIKKNNKKKKSASHPHKHHHHHKHENGDDDHDHRKKEGAKEKKQDSKILKIFGFGSRKANHHNNKPSSVVGGAGEFGGSSHSESMPSLGHMKRFASGRQSLANFDWTAQIAPVNDLDDRNFHSDEEFGRYSNSDDSEGEEAEVIIPFSAPILRGGLQEPRKEVNLWQRRNTASPPPLQIKPIKVRAE